MQTVNTLRIHVNNIIRWAQQYRSASIISCDNNPDSPSPYIEFTDESRPNDGPVLGETSAAPEIAALLYTSGRQNLVPAQSQVVVRTQSHVFCHYGVHLMKTLQFALLFLHGEAGWSKGHPTEDSPSKSKTMNRTNTHPVHFPLLLPTAHIIRANVQDPTVV